MQINNKLFADSSGILSFFLTNQAIRYTINNINDGGIINEREDL